MKIQIRCTRKEGLWRAGVFHPGEVVTHDATRFDERQQTLLRDEPLLEITCVEEAPLCPPGPLADLATWQHLETGRLVELPPHEDPGSGWLRVDFPCAADEPEVEEIQAEASPEHGAPAPAPAKKGKK